MLLIERIKRAVVAHGGVPALTVLLPLMKLGTIGLVRILLISRRIKLFARVLGGGEQFAHVWRRRILLHGPDPLHHGLVVARLKQVLAIAERVHLEHVLAFRIVVGHLDGRVLQVDRIRVHRGNHNVVLLFLAQEQGAALFQHGPRGSPRPVRRPLAVFAHDLAVQHALLYCLEKCGQKVVRGDYVLIFDRLQDNWRLNYKTISTIKYLGYLVSKYFLSNYRLIKIDENKQVNFLFFVFESYTYLVNYFFKTRLENDEENFGGLESIPINYEISRIRILFKLGIIYSSYLRYFNTNSE